MLNTRERTSTLQVRSGVVLRRAGELLLMAALARASIVGELSPFAVSLFAASLFAGASPVCLVAGCVLGSPWEALGIRAIAPVAGCLIVLGGYLILRITSLGDKLLSSYGKRTFKNEDAVIASLAALGALLPTMALSIGSPQQMLLSALNALVALAVAPVLTGAVSLTWKRTCLLPDEQLSLAILAMIFLLGVTRSPLQGLAAPIAALITLLGAASGAGGGAAVGIMTGAALSFSSANPMIGASLGLMGLIAGATRSLGKGWSALGFLLTNAATLAFGTGTELGTLSLAAAVPVAVIFMLMPEAVFDKIRCWMARGGGGAQPDELALRLRQSSEKRLRALATVFDDMGAGYGDVVKGPDETALIGQMRRALCAGCLDYAKCWNGQDARAGRMLLSLLSGAFKGEAIGEAGELPPEYGRLCRRAPQIPKRLGALLTGFEMRRRQALERQNAGTMLSRHFRKASELLYGMAGDLTRPLTIDAALSRIALAALEKAGIEATGVLALDMGALEVTATIEEGLWDGASASRAAAALSQAMGLPMRSALLPDGRMLEKEMRFVQAPRLSATVGYACRSRDGGAPSGDSHLAAGLTGARVLLALSDGMGSGPRAQEESAKTIRLIRRFMLAEVDRDLMLDAVNQLLMMRGEEDMYATADLAVLDMQEGRAEFMKLGACASYVIRKGQLMRVEGGQLPLGILDSVTPGASETGLRAGDVLVMFTDGVADTASEEQSAWIEGVLLEHRREAPGQLCASVIEKASARGTKDDMTVLAAKIARA